MAKNIKLKQPTISVVMAVYNNEPYLRKAIESILNQTFSDVEFIIIDDGSTDSTWKIIKSFSDKRIIALQNSKNQGLSYSLNKGIKLAKGKYIARMDGDDISLPQRFELQIKFLEKHPEVGVLGTHLKIVGSKKSFFKYPATHEEIKISMLYSNPMGNPSAIIKAKLFKTLLYNEKFMYTYAEDYELWSKLINQTRFANLKNPLLIYSYNPHPKAKKGKLQRVAAISIMSKLLKNLGMNKKDIDLKSHLILSRIEIPKNYIELKSLFRWCLLIIHHNKSSQVYEQKLLMYLLIRRYIYIVCESVAPKIIRF